MSNFLTVTAVFTVVLNEMTAEHSARGQQGEQICCTWGSLATNTQSAGKAGIQNRTQWYKSFNIQKGALNYNPSPVSQRCVWENLDA